MATFPKIYCDQVYPTVPVSDVKRSIKFYTEQLGFSLRFTWGDPVTFAGVNLDKTSIHLMQTSATGQQAWVNFIVADADTLFAMHQQNGVTIPVPIADREYGIRDYQVEDPDGNKLGFGHYIYNQGPEIKIERVDVPVRLEKRLAALLHDLAAHKHMSVSGCLEETLLHTFERVGDSVASPHTLATLDYIQDLRKKHGIDYDTHASYRFVE